MQEVGVALFSVRGGVFVIRLKGAARWVIVAHCVSSPARKRPAGLR